MMFNKLETIISNELKSIWEKYKTTVVVAFVVIPFLIQIFLKLFNLLSSFSGWGIALSFSSDWLGFWGSYLGVIPSGLIAASVASYQIRMANVQSSEARKQELIIMRNTKIIDYLYEIKNSISRSKIILDQDNSNLSDKLMFDYMKKGDYALFGEMNWNVLTSQNNNLYFLIGIVFDQSIDREVFSNLVEYTENMKLLQEFLLFYENFFESSGTVLDNSSKESYVDYFKIIKEEEKLKDMVAKLDEIETLVSSRIEKLSA
ncbi:MAG: hypothetical protein ABF519_07100 [Leuconostoc mesenteroides]